MKPRIFIDGEHGTTGLQIRSRLAGRTDLDVISIPEAERRNKAMREDFLKQADIAILCLPDEGSREAVEMLAGTNSTRLIDTATAHRVDPDWVYGFAEMDKDQAAKIARARLVANPGCYPTGAIALVRPLVDAGIMPVDYPLTINAVSGYSGGGRQMIEAFEAGDAPAFELYGLTLEHKHLPEMQRYCGLERRPIFVPSVGNYRQGMLVSVPLHLSTLNGGPVASDLRAVLEKRYAGSDHVSVRGDADTPATIEPEGPNETNRLELSVHGNDRHAQAVLVARLDNLGKGASGAAVQNIRLMLGLD